MQYDPLKDKISALIELVPGFRKLFYFAMDAMLLRQRYVKRCISALVESEQSFCFYDAGAGFCQYSDYILQHYPAATVHAVDLKTDYLWGYNAQLKEDNKKRFSFARADLQNYLPPDKYDIVCAIDILEHIEDDLGTLKLFHKAMNSGAHLIISTPSDMDEAAKFTAEHVRPGYNKVELESKLQACGFEIVNSVYTYGYWGSLAWKLLIRNPMQYYAKYPLFKLLLPFYFLAIYPIANIMMSIDLKMNKAKGTGLLVHAKRV